MQATFVVDGVYQLAFKNEEDWLVSVTGNGDAYYGSVLCPTRLRPTAAHPTRSWKPFADMLVILVRDNYELSETDAEHLAVELEPIISSLV